MKNVLLVLSLVSLVLSASAKIEMGAPFSDGAILQRGMTVPVWGRVVPDAEDLAAATEAAKAVRQIVTGEDPYAELKAKLKAEGKI